MNATTAGKALISVTAMAQMIGPYVFDFNETHIYNDSWPQLRYAVPIMTVIGTGWAVGRRGLSTKGETR